jgi:uncharacterized protein (TIGR03382 family)
MRILVSMLASVALLVSARVAYAGACAPQGWQAEMLTKPGQVIPSSGGIIAGIKPGMYEEKRPDNPAARNWVLRSGKKTIPLVAETLAPGLARYRPKRPAAAGAWTVQPRKVADAKRTGPDRPVSFAKAGVTPLAAPSVGSVHSFRHKADPAMVPPSFRGRITDYVTVRLTQPAPATAIGLILYDGSASTGAPMLFRRTGAGLRDVTMYSTPGRCRPYLRAWRRPRAGQSVTAAWVDATGTLSPRSTVLTVSGDAPGPQKQASASAPPVPPAPTPPPPGPTAVNTKAAAPAQTPPKQPAPPAKKSSKGCSSSTDGGGVVLLLGALLLLVGRRPGQALA